MTPGGIMKRTVQWLGIFALALLVAGCTTPSSRTNADAKFEWTSPSKRILIVEPDIQLSLLDAGGVLEPRADWTETARGVFDKGIKDHFTKSGTEVVSSGEPTPHEAQLMKLHNAVGVAILTHLYGPQGSSSAGANQLPNKGSALDWTLGPGTADMRDHYGADYALFIFVRDSYSSAAKKALDVFAVVAGAALGVGIVPTGGVQIGFASLVDLRTGNIVWFNRAIDGMGDLREEAKDARATDQLLKDIPI
jgi:hypothetical protein